MKNLIKSGLSGNQLKVIAAILMTIDHIGLYLFPGISIFRIIGRLSFPIFAYTFSEGCKYTKNRLRHIGVLFCVAVLFQLVYTNISGGSLYMNILITFTMSAAVIYSVDFAMNKKKVTGYLLALLVFAGVIFISYVVPMYLGHRNFAIDYGFFGVMLPVLVYYGRDKKEKLILLSIGLLLVATAYTTRQFFALFAVPIIALYNGTRGKRKMKYFFYIYYPAHIAIIVTSYILWIVLKTYIGSFI